MKHLHISANRKNWMRWAVAGALFAITVINYVDRQSLSLLAPMMQLGIYTAGATPGATLGLPLIANVSGRLEWQMLFVGTGLARLRGDIGAIIPRHGYTPIFVAMGLLHLLALMLVRRLRTPRKTEVVVRKLSGACV